MRLDWCTAQTGYLGEPTHTRIASARAVRGSYAVCRSRGSKSLSLAVPLNRRKFERCEHVTWIVTWCSIDCTRSNDRIQFLGSLIVWLDYSNCLTALWRMEITK